MPAVISAVLHVETGTMLSHSALYIGASKGVCVYVHMCMCVCVHLEMGTMLSHSALYIGDSK